MAIDLTSLRQHINQLDDQLLTLLNERAKIATEIGTVKASTGTDVYDPNRERAIIERLERLNGGPLGTGAIDEIFTAIIAACREIQIKK